MINHFYAAPHSSLPDLPSVGGAGGGGRLLCGRVLCGTWYLTTPPSREDRVSLPAYWQVWRVSVESECEE
jgi:hypothetical protein